VGEKVVEFVKGYEVTFDTALVNDCLTRQKERIDRLIGCKDGSENVYEIRTAMQNELMEHVGIFRDHTGLQTAVETLQDIHERSQRVGLRSNGLGANPELTLALKIRGMVRLALCAAYGALHRTESRGCHAREDYEARNDREWLNRTLATWKDGEGLPTLTYEPASKVEILPPGSRGYGATKVISRDGDMTGA
jgi:fumarate reductase flavoprotein subunit